MTEVFRNQNYHQKPAKPSCQYRWELESLEVRMPRENSDKQLRRLGLQHWFLYYQELTWHLTYISHVQQCNQSSLTKATRVKSQCLLVTLELSGSVINYGVDSIGKPSDVGKYKYRCGGRA